MSFPKYRKKPVVVEAAQLRAPENTESLAKWCGGKTAFVPEGMGILINTLEGEMLAKPGDYIIKGVEGEFYPCKGSIFEATYEPA